jgi:hypothetical protein
MYKIAVMGDYDSIYGFAALGLDTFPVKDNAEAAKELKTLATSGYAIIYITESLASALNQKQIGIVRHAAGHYSDPGHFRQYGHRDRQREEICGAGRRFRYHFQ